MKVVEALAKALEEFNNILADEDKTLDMKLEYFSPRLAKKNGKPKTDLPCKTNQI